MMAENENVWTKTSNIGVVCNPESNRYALMNLRTGKAIVLTGVASEIWELLDRENHERTLIHILASAYVGQDEQIATETCHFLNDLHMNNFIEPHK